MKKIKITTNLVLYSEYDFLRNLTEIPKIGEEVSVTKLIKPFYEKEKLPTKLTVVNITHFEDEVIVELFYSQKDLENAKKKNINLFEIYKFI